jgi:hypothetical protein
MGKINKYEVLVVVPQGKRPLGGDIHTWKVDTLMDLRKAGLDAVELIHLAQDKDWWPA